jgi:1-deoxy-D-xylulose-5-phosphate synthase
MRPVVSIYSTFIQRSVDQLIHDVALQNLPVIFALDRAGLVPEDGETHQGIFDIALFRSIPHVNILAPAGKSEMDLMLQWMLRQEPGQEPDQSGPFVIRYPKAACPLEDSFFSVPIKTGRGVFVRKTNASVCIAFTGSLYNEVEDARKILSEAGIEVDLYNLRFIKPIDETYLLNILSQYEYFIVVEEGLIQGGVGEYIISISKRNSQSADIIHIGIPDRIIPQGTRSDLLHQTKLDGEGIAEQVVLRIPGIAEQVVLRIPGIAEQMEHVSDTANYGEFKVVAAL